MTTGFTLRPMTGADLPAAHALSGAVGWPHRLEDWRFVLGLGEGLVAEAAGQVVATALAWRFGPRRAGIGMVIVAPAFQGRGLGRRLMDAMLPGLDGHAVVLHATDAGAPLYRRLGFVPAGRVRQHQGIAAPVAVAPDAAVRVAGAGDLAVLAALDAAATGLARHDVLAALLPVAEALVLERAGLACGFACIRPFGRGRVVGPVVARDAEDAKRLIAHAIARHRGAFLRIDVAAESGLSAWLDAQGLAAVDEVTRMVRGPDPLPSGGTRRFALVNQALG